MAKHMAKKKARAHARIKVWTETRDVAKVKAAQRKQQLQEFIHEIVSRA